MFYDKFYISNPEGRRLACLLFLPSEKPRFQMAVAHGFRGAKENSGRIEGFAGKVTALGGSVLAFDFSGSGESEGAFADMTLSRQVQDLRGVIEHSVSRDQSPLILLGRSFGGTTALAAAAEDQRVQGLILWSAPVFLTETFFKVAPQDIQNLPTGALKAEDDQGAFVLGPGFAQDLPRHDFSRYLQGLGNRPLLVIHGENDGEVDPKNAGFLGEHALGPVELHLVPGADHRFTRDHLLREEITLEWLDRFFIKKVAK